MEKICPGCQRPNPADAAFCRHCASSLPAGMGGQGFPPPNQQWHRPSPPPGGGMPGNFAQPAASGGASGRAIASMILAICSFFFCCLFASVPAAILGWIEINAIKEGRSSPSGMTMTQIGLWGGIIVTVLSLIFSGLFFLTALMDGGGGYYYY
jgi:hypothetical protein